MLDYAPNTCLGLTTSTRFSIYLLEYLSIYLSQSRITRTSPRNPCSSASPLQPTDTGVEIAVAPVTDTGLLPKIAALAECRPSDALWPDPLKRKCVR